MPIYQETLLFALEGMEEYRKAIKLLKSIIREAAGFQSNSAEEWQKEVVGLEAQSAAITIDPKYGEFIAEQRMHYKHFSSRNFMKRKAGVSSSKSATIRTRGEGIKESNTDEKLLRAAIQRGLAKNIEKPIEKTENKIEIVDMPEGIQDITDFKL